MRCEADLVCLLLPDKSRSAKDVAIPWLTNQCWPPTYLKVSSLAFLNKLRRRLLNMMFSLLPYHGAVLVHLEAAIFTEVQIHLSFRRSELFCSKSRFWNTDGGLQNPDALFLAQHLAIYHSPGMDLALFTFSLGRIIDDHLKRPAGMNVTRIYTIIAESLFAVFIIINFYIFLYIIL